MAFVKATKKQAKLRLALIGLAGSGKTYSALSIATALVPNGRVAVIDTERGSASLYSDRFAFDVQELQRHSPHDYVEALADADADGYDVVVIDSLSHAWMGKDGALEQVDKAAKRSGSGSTFTAWRDVTPMHNRLVDAMLSCRAHLIVTLRSKMEYVLEPDDRGKMAPRKVGLAPVQREGLDYEFTIVGDLNLAHDLIVSKSRADVVPVGDVISKPGAQLARKLADWLASGEAPIPQPEITVAPAIVAVDREEGSLTTGVVVEAVENGKVVERSLLSELDARFAEYLGGIMGANDMAELDRAATSPAKPEKGTREHELATRAYKTRKAEILSGAAS